MEDIEGLTSTSRICSRTALVLRCSSATAAALTLDISMSRCLVLANASIMRRFNFSAGVRSCASAAELGAAALFCFTTTLEAAGGSGESRSLSEEEYNPRSRGKKSETKRQRGTRDRRWADGKVCRGCMLTCRAAVSGGAQEKSLGGEHMMKRFFSGCITARACSCNGIVTGFVL